MFYIFSSPPPTILKEIFVQFYVFSATPQYTNPGLRDLLFRTANPSAPKLAKWIERKQLHQIEEKLLQSY